MKKNILRACALAGSGLALAVGLALPSGVASAAAARPAGTPGTEDCSFPVGHPEAIWAYGNDRWVSAELGFNGFYYAMLRARATAIGSWERYTVAFAAGIPCTYTIKSLANGKYVAANFSLPGDVNGMLNASDGSSLGSASELFRFLYEPQGRFAIIGVGQLVGGKPVFVSAELGYVANGYGMLRARASVVGPWEQFAFQTTT